MAIFRADAKRYLAVQMRGARGGDAGGGEPAIFGHALNQIHRRAADKACDKGIGGVGIDLIRGADLLDRALVHDDDPVGQCHRLDLVMRHIDRGDFQLALQMLDLHPHAGAQLGVKVRQRFIHQEHLRRAHHGAGKGGALALATRQSAGFAIQIAAQFHHIGGLADQAVMVRLGHPAHPQRKADILVNRHVGVKRIALKHHRHVTVAGIDFGHYFVADDDLAFGRMF